MKPKYKGFVKIDAWLVPKKEAGAYKRRIKRCRKIAKNCMATFCCTVYTDYRGSQDGEAVIGKDKDGVIIAFIHLDPQGLEDIEKGVKDGNLKDVLSEI